MGLSAVLIVKDEEKNIRACLESLAFANEIVVVDSGSRDRTIELAKLQATRVESRVFDDFASQKNFAVSLATQEWVLSIDADERISPELRDEILGVIKKSDGPNAYAVLRRTNLFGRDFVASGLQNDAPVRLFRRGKAQFINPVHEILKVEGQIGRLKKYLQHVSFQTVREHLEKMQLYTSLEAQKGEQCKAVRGFSHILLRPMYRFFSIYVLKQGFRDGREGFSYAALSAFYEGVRWMKIWESCESA